MENAADENWELLLSLLPPIGAASGAVWRRGALARLPFDRGSAARAADARGQRLLAAGDAVRARRLGLAQASDVALLLRLRKVEPGGGSCAGRCCRRRMECGRRPGRWNLRALDGTLVQEAGRTGTQWRIHYSLRLPSLECDSFEITPARGPEPGRNWSGWR